MTLHKPIGNAAHGMPGRNLILSLLDRNGDTDDRTVLFNRSRC
jgi:hypothetical protein